MPGDKRRPASEREIFIKNYFRLLPILFLSLYFLFLYNFSHCLLRCQIEIFFFIFFSLIAHGSSFDRTHSPRTCFDVPGSYCIFDLQRGEEKLTIGCIKIHRINFCRDNGQRDGDDRSLTLFKQRYIDESRIFFVLKQMPLQLVTRTSFRYFVLNKRLSFY